MNSTVVGLAKREVTSDDLLVGGGSRRNARGLGWEGFKDNRSVEKADLPPKRSDMSSPALRLFSRFVWGLC